MKYNVGDVVNLKSYYVFLPMNAEGQVKYHKITSDIHEPIIILYKEEFFYQVKFYSDDTIYLITDEAIEQEAEITQIDKELLIAEQNKVPKLVAAREMLKAFFSLNNTMSLACWNLKRKGKNVNMKKTIVFDFDGVIHTGYDGYRDGSIYGGIDYELLDFIKSLLDKYYVCICSNRPKQQIIDFMNNLCYNELEFVDGETNLPFFNEEGKIGVSNSKIAGIIYIDDRGYRYSNLDKMKKDLSYIFDKGDE